MKLPFFLANAFTKQPFKGNLAGVVLEAHDLNENIMQHIAAELRCSETAFIVRSENATLTLKFFSPLMEVDLCGHATIATLYSLMKSNILRQNQVMIQTNAGFFPVDISGDMVFMTQAKPVFRQANISTKEIADALRIKENAVDNLPIESVSTGLFSLIVPISNLDTMRNMDPDFAAVAQLCKKRAVGSLFAFTFDTIIPECFTHARCFAPLYGVNEDPVTGTANGALGAYLKKHGLLATKIFKSEQGFEMGREGVVTVDVSKTAVQVGGTAYITLSGELRV
jgi:PhzF family phenazine biosynthesis protein